MASKHKAYPSIFYDGNSCTHGHGQGCYQKWCKKNNFLLMLPDDAKEQKAAEHVTLQQTQVDDHFAKAQPEDKLPLYTDELFKEVAIKWLIQTDQVSFYFTNTKFNICCSL